MNRSRGHFLGLRGVYLGCLACIRFKMMFHFLVVINIKAITILL